jgi:predicted dehydrogenase
MILSQKTAAVAGTGFIGPVHVEALRRLGIRVKGILGSSPAKSEIAAKTLGLPKAYVSYEEIPSDPDVEVVHIATPNRQLSRRPQRRFSGHLQTTLSSDL